jgi:DNA-binding transcriptional ArsR family regulator
MSAALDAALAALADPVRRRAVEVLGEGPCAAGALAQRLGVAPAALSKHLRTLKTAGLVEDAHPAFDARVRIYSLNGARVAAVRAWLEETEALWARQLSAFKAHVEGDP